jgi:hypothetical protein
MDDRDIQIVIDNLPTDILSAGMKRPGDTAGLDIDDITQSSFNTQGLSKAPKVPRFDPPTPSDNEQLRRLELERQENKKMIASLESQVTQLLSRLSATDPTSATPTSPSDDSH